MRDNELFDEFYTRQKKYIIHLNKTEANQIYELKSRLNKRFYFKVNDGIQYASLDQVITKYHNLAYTFIESDLRFPRENRGEKKNTSTSTTAPSSRRTNNRTPGNASSLNAAARTNSNRIPFPEKYKGLPKLTDTLKAQLNKKDRCYNYREVRYRFFNPSYVLKIQRNGRTVKLNSTSINILNQPLTKLSNNNDQGNEFS